ncbi:MAG: molecular chaperone DnaJ [Candidatus Nanopelagicales bacterium]
MAADEGFRREWIDKDYYKDLGVPKKADAAEIKKTYRKLARKYHPDANPDDKKAEARFKEVSEAYDVIGDADQRKKYDEVRQMAASGGFRYPGGAAGGPQGGFSSADFGDMFGGGANAGGGQGGFSDIFGGLFNRGGGQRQPRATRGNDIESDVTLGFVDALTGVSMPLRLSSEGICETCHGSGARPGTTPQTCPVCGGSGSRVHNQGGFAFSEPCDACHGRGVIIEDACPTCRGAGVAVQTKTINARIPAGVKDGQKIRLKGKGGAGANGGPAGDLFLRVHVTKDPVFARDGKNVTVTVPVAFDEAALGSTIKVPVPTGGTVQLRIPAGTANGKKFRVKGKGAQTSPPGDLIATVAVAVPADLSDDEKAAIESLREARAGADPRAELLKKAER